MLKLILISDQFPTNLSPPTTAEALVLRNESASAQIQSGENKDFRGPTQMEAPQEQGRVRGSVFLCGCIYKTYHELLFLFGGRGSCFSTPFFSLGEGGGGKKSSSREFDVLKYLFFFLWLAF